MAEFVATVTIPLHEYKMLVESKKILDEGMNYTSYVNQYGQQTSVRKIETGALAEEIVSQVKNCVNEVKMLRDQRDTFRDLLSDLKRGYKKVTDIPDSLWLQN